MTTPAVAVGTAWPPLILAVAPTGARLTKADHAALPMTADEIARDAARCLERGACMVHLHVRDHNGRHTLDVDAYRDATAAIRRATGERLIVPATSEAAGLYAPAEQMAVIRGLCPQAIGSRLRAGSLTLPRSTGPYLSR